MSSWKGFGYHHHHWSLRRAILEGFSEDLCGEAWRLKRVTGEEILDDVLGFSSSWRGFPSSIVEIEGVFSMVYFIVLALVDCSWSILVMSG